MSEVRIAPSILSADFARMGEEIAALEIAGADLIHADVMDGVFVPNITFGIKMVADIKKRAKLPIDAHLMIVNPQNYISRFAEAGADYITVHYEACGDNLSAVLKSIKEAGAKCGAVINPDTEVGKIKGVIELCDMVLLMSVFPGFGGQRFIESVLPKVEEAAEIIRRTGKKIDLEIDGGITLDNVARVKNAGANVIVAGNTVFKAADRRAVIEELRTK